MRSRRKILVVAPSVRLAASLVTSLGEAHHEFVMVSTFSAAMVYLGQRPDLLITEVKLGEYNGLHLALRGRAIGIPAIVLGSDLLLEREAEQLGATYLPVAELRFDELDSLIQTLPFESSTRFRWPDMSVTDAMYCEGATVVH